MRSLNAYRLPTGELVLPAATSSSALGELSLRLLSSDFVGICTALIVSLSALWVVGG